MKNNILAIVLATIWINISEFVRNEFLLNSNWMNHYKNLGLTFPDESINGALWGIWGLVFAICIYFISKKFSLIETTILCWVLAFVLTWIVTGNLGVLPLSILYIAIPLSLLEVFFATFIIKKTSKN